MGLRELKKVSIFVSKLVSIYPKAEMGLRAQIEV